jgi:hypothetical protein
MAVMTSERQSAVDAITAERKAAFESLDAERVVTLQGIDLISKQSLDAAALRARGVVDYVFWRLVILVLLSSVLAVAALRLGRQRGTRT